MEGIQTGKDIVKLSLFVDNIKDSKISPTKFLERISKFNNVAGYKINFHKAIAILYINSKHTEIEIMETLLFPITSKKIKCIEINRTMEVKDLDNENFKLLKKETEKGTRKWESISISFFFANNYPFI